MFFSYPLKFEDSNTIREINKQNNKCKSFYRVSRENFFNGFRNRKTALMRKSESGKKPIAGSRKNLFAEYFNGYFLIMKKRKSRIFLRRTKVITTEEPRNH